MKQTSDTEDMLFGVVSVFAPTNSVRDRGTFLSRRTTSVPIDRMRARARAVAADLHYGAPLCPRITIRNGDYADLAGAGLVMITAGVNEKNESRL
jgi:hypothetical protein